MTNWITCPHCSEQVDGDAKPQGKYGKILKEILIDKK